MVSSLQERGKEFLTNFIKFYKTNDFFDEGEHENDEALLTAHRDYLEYMDGKSKMVLRHWKRAFSSKKPQVTIDTQKQLITEIFIEMAKEVNEFKRKHNEQLTEKEKDRLQNVYHYYLEHFDWSKFISENNSNPDESDYYTESDSDEEDNVPNVSARISRLLCD